MQGHDFVIYFILEINAGLGKDVDTRVNILSKLIIRLGKTYSPPQRYFPVGKIKIKNILANKKLFYHLLISY